MAESPDSGQACALGGEVEVTPEMIEAGLNDYRETLHPMAGKEPDDDLKVAEIFRVMFRARQESEADLIDQQRQRQIRNFS